MISSAWKLTLDPAGTPLVLLDYGDLLATELEFAGRRGVTLTPLVRAAAPHMRDGKNLSMNLSFRIHRPLATWPLARAAAMATAMNSLAKAKAPLRIEAEGVDGYTQYAECLVSEASGVLDEGEGSWHVTNFSLVATSASVVVPPDYGILTVQGGPFTDFNSDSFSWGDLNYNTLRNGKPEWTDDGADVGTDGYLVTWSGTAWESSRIVGSSVLFYASSAEDVATPDLVNTWVTTDGGGVDGTITGMTLAAP